MSPLALSLKSLLHRRWTVGLTVSSLALGVTLLLGVERMRQEARHGFTNTLSGTDLIVGARTGPTSLLLSTIFGVGYPSQNISWETYQSSSDHPMVAWTIPLSLGDSHRGFRVVGTTSDYFLHYRYANRRALAFASGEEFGDVQDAVLGAAVARELGHNLHDQVVLSHGTGEVSFVDHDEHPFRVVGILEPTGTPVDRAVLISLKGMDAVHADWHQAPGEHDHPGHFHPSAPGSAQLGDLHDHLGEHPPSPPPSRARELPPDASPSEVEAAMLELLEELAQGASHDSPSGSSTPDPPSDSLLPPSSSGLTGLDRLAEIEAALAAGDSTTNSSPPREITAFLVGLHNRADAVFLQRSLNTSPSEPLTAIMPGVALEELWQVVGVVEKTLLLISIFVVAVSLAGMLSALMTSLNERRREMAILRSVGARPVDVLALVVGEAAVLTSLAIALGVAGFHTLLILARPAVLAETGVHLSASLLSVHELGLLGLVLAVGTLVGIIPAWRCYRHSLSDGLTITV